MSTKFFTIERRSIFPKGWGDYGDILQHGMSARVSRSAERLSIERTGPYILPITLPGIGDIVVTSSAREQMERSGLSGFSFLPVEKTLIVELHWELWNLDTDKPAEYPASGEPEDYILGKPHNASVASQLGELWEVVIPSTATIIRPQSIVKSFHDLKFDLASWNGADLLRSDDYGSALFSARAHDWFTAQWDRYVGFEEFATA